MLIATHQPACDLSYGNHQNAWGLWYVAGEAVPIHLFGRGGRDDRGGHREPFGLGERERGGHRDGGQVLDQLVLWTSRDGGGEPDNLFPSSVCENSLTPANARHWGLNLTEIPFSF